MSVITVRNLPPAVEKAVRAKAKRERLSLNKAVVRLLEEATGEATDEPKKAVHHDLDRFFGGWTREEAEAFDRALQQQRQIEPDMWK